MKITVCGSVAFAEKLVDVCRRLEELGHQSIMHEDMFGIADGSAPELIDGIKINHAEVKRKYGFIKIWYNLILKSDAILVCNFDKNGVKNHIGGNTLMEMGFAHVNDKKVFLLNPIPEKVPYTDEIEAMVDVVLDGDLKRID
ncbi:MAG: hypothetical protein KAT35_01240 [Candidatus Aenigmarchaeota archaeon]|nr:hypothetical protein [Candidatus Aenigmarchaeota archaeon]